MTEQLSIHLKIIGTLLLMLSFVHVIFPSYFKWKDQLKELSLINRQMMWVHTFFIALMVLLNGLLCVFYPAELITTKLGRVIAIGLAIFWTIRLITQLFVYSSRLWKGKRFETGVHIMFTIFWCYLSGVFWLIGLG